MIADATKRSTKAHLYHFYNVFCKILSLPRSLPSSLTSDDQNDDTAVKGSLAVNEMQSVMSVSVNSDLKEEVNARRLVYLCLLEIGKDVEAQ